MITIAKQLFGLVVVLSLIAGVPVLASEITVPVSSSGQIIPTLPVPPTTSQADSQITVNWQASPGAEGYKVYRIKDGGSPELITPTPLGAGTLSYTDSNLEDGNYSYQVQPFLGTLSPNLNSIAPTAPVSIVTPTPTPTPSGGGGGGGGGSSSTTSTPTPTPTPLTEAAKKVDVNNDSKIDILDFNALIVNWGSMSSGNVADFNGNGVVDILDFNLLMVNWTG